MGTLTKSKTYSKTRELTQSQKFTLKRGNSHKVKNSTSDFILYVFLILVEDVVRRV
ncbi:hypothetical protein LEP1GSC186_2341 [Leptospira noguchii serovar Autumnalis str. ZUN142]|uniref:Cupin domain protein n=1 Tax=Leptospira noguchii serovar Autumnalis str. ZUN142 TaxID=1085540 RepID=M6UEJ6_9LEPT|nr:hypothetical protein LEP1GSC186_2341 [Leptospira noguchii serovar Autumnalis str. ZUN142]